MEVTKRRGFSAAEVIAQAALKTAKSTKRAVRTGKLLFALVWFNAKYDLDIIGGPFFQKLALTSYPVHGIESHRAR